MVTEKTMKNGHYCAFLTLLRCSFVNIHDRKTIQSLFLVYSGGFTLLNVEICFHGYLVTMETEKQ